MAVPLKVLVADDDPVTRLMVVRSLASVTGAVLQAANGLEALFVVERDDPDLLITDVQMPVLSGFDLIDALRRVDSSRALPVILLSSLKDRSAILRLKEAGISKYLLKPVRPDDLVERVKEVAAASQGWRAQRPRRASTSVLVVVPDHVLRSRIRSALEPQWRVGEAASAAEAGVRLLARVETPDLVLVAEGMAPFSEGQLADLVRTASAAARVMPPPV